MPTVSVILPTCDRPHLWPRALESVLRQTWTDLEVVLVDSNRNSPPLHHDPRFAEATADSRVRLVAAKTKPRLSAAAARNAGLEVARGDWITFLDDDDVYLPNKLSVQFARARETGAALVLCGFTVVLPCRRRTRQIGVAEFRGDALLTDTTWGTPFFFFKHDREAKFDESLRAGEDEVFAHAFLKRHGIGCVPNCAQSLIEVYPQIEAARVHSNSEAAWRAFRANWPQTAGRFSPGARRQYLAMGRLARARTGYGSRGYFLRCAWAALVVRGPRAWRPVLNAAARRSGWLERWVVS